MKVSRSGYYKWLKTKDILNNYELNRNNMCDLVKEYHKKHPSWGYRSYKYRKTGEESIKYPNLVKGNWNVTKTLELIVTDMTCIKYRDCLYDTVLYMDAFNIEILAYSYTKKHNSIVPYYEGLNVILDKIKGINYSTTLHSDQGVVYSSIAFTNAHKDYNIGTLIVMIHLMNSLTHIFIIIIRND